MLNHPSTKLPQDKRTLLFQVSSGEFASNGFKQASLNRIIAKVGMSKSSFYHYFTNKTDLFQQTIDQAVEPILRDQAAFDFDSLNAENLWPTLVQMSGEMIKLVNSSPDLVTIVRMFFRCMEDPEECALVAPYMDQFTDWLTTLLNRGQVLKMFRDDLPDSLLIDVLMAMGMSVDRWMLARWDEIPQTERMQISQKTFELFVRLLTPEN